MQLPADGAPRSRLLVNVKFFVTSLVTPIEFGRRALALPVRPNTNDPGGSKASVPTRG